MHASQRRLALVWHLRGEEDTLEPCLGRGVFGVELSTQQEKEGGEDELIVAFRSAKVAGLVVLPLRRIV